MKKYFKFLVLISILSIANCNPRRNGDRVSKRMCSAYVNLVTLKSSTGMCYPDESLRACLKARTTYNCKYATTGLIVGGEKTLPGEFPHMAAIGWKSGDGYLFGCGGSLISDKFVLTVAHCNKYKSESPAIVRLGDQNLATLDDGAQPVDYKIKTFINHEKYSSKTKENDIALIELDKSVSFTEFIRPACLFQGGKKFTNVIATGWGKNGTFAQTTDELQKVKFNVVSNPTCKIVYEEEEDKEIFSRQICAGSKGKDTCQGDSGGPIQISHPKVHCVLEIVGLTSYGPYICGSSIPGVYTRVTSYLDWIEAKVWP